jgi:hypothetical protein
MNKCEQIIDNWLAKTIIGLNLCPFAKQPYQENQIRITSSSLPDEDSQIKFFLDELAILQSDSDISTALVVFENGNSDFYNFYNLTGLLEDMIDQLKLADEFQLVVFHPKFLFENTVSSERVNFVNRSPYPLIHIIRSIDIENALSSPQEGEKISFNNEETLKKLTNAEFLEHFPSTFYSE